MKNKVSSKTAVIGEISPQEECRHTLLPEAAEKAMGGRCILSSYEGTHNVLFPDLQLEQISPLHSVRIETVRLSPNPQDGDVYVLAAGTSLIADSPYPAHPADSPYPAQPGYRPIPVKLALTKLALLKLARAAGITWNWAETKAVFIERDYCLYEAVAAVRKPDGEWVSIKGSKEINLEVIEEIVYEENLEKYGQLGEKEREGLTGEEWAADKTKKTMRKMAANKLMMAETGAMLRAIRALLTVKSTYTPEEISRPFAVPTIHFAPDYTDPQVRTRLLEEGIRTTTELYGPSNRETKNNQQAEGPGRQVTGTRQAAVTAFSREGSYRQARDRKRKMDTLNPDETARHKAAASRKAGKKQEESTGEDSGTEEKEESSVQTAQSKRSLPENEKSKEEKEESLSTGDTEQKGKRAKDKAKTKQNKTKTKQSTRQKRKTSTLDR